MKRRKTKLRVRWESEHSFHIEWRHCAPVARSLPSFSAGYFATLEALQRAPLLR